MSHLQFEDEFEDEESSEDFTDSPDLEDEPQSIASVAAKQHDTIVKRLPSSSLPRRLRVRPMSAKMAARYPNIVSIVYTRDNGQQIIFVKR